LLVLVIDSCRIRFRHDQLVTEGGVERRALAAASAVAAARGLPCSDAAVVHSGSNVIVHFRPAPVVARVMSGTVVLHDDPQRWLGREVSVLTFLAPSGVAVAPSSLIAPGPYHHDGLWMTFCEWLSVADEPDRRVDAVALGRCLRRLHDELLGFSGELGGLDEVGEDIRRLYRLLRPTAGVSAQTIDALRERLAALDDVVFRASLPTQALHGDASITNLPRTPQGLIWNDFEDTFRGPVHWDLASFVSDLRGRGADAHAVRRFLDAYAWRGEERELAPFIAAQDVYYEIWELYRGQRAGPSGPACAEDR
jgi:Phosphotransferase enzyme family